MRKLSTLLTLLVVSTGLVSAVNLPLDFESGTYTFIDFDGGNTTVIDNPQSSGINTSAKVAQMVKNAGQVWAGSWIAMDDPIDFTTNKTFKMKVFSPRVGAKVLLKVENMDNGGIFFEKEVATSHANEWEELSFDYSSVSTSASYQKVVIIFDNGTAGDGSADFTFLFDDIELINDGSAAEGPSLPLDFENPDLTYAFIDFDGGVATVIDNPQSAGINTSATVAQMVKNAGQVWAGSKLALVNAIDFTTYQAFTMKVFSPRANVPVLLKLENADGSQSAESTANTTVANEWEILTYDFRGSASGVYDNLVFIFDNGTAGDGSEDFTFLFDDIEMTGNGSNLSQIDLPLDFESSTVNYTMTDFGGNVTAIGEDPADAENKVAITTKTAGSETWAGTTMSTDLGLMTALPFTAEETKISVRVYSHAAGIQVRLKAEDHTDATKTAETEATTTMANEWEVLVFDFSNVADGTNPFDLSTTYDKLSIFFNFNVSGNGEVYYWDDVEFGDSSVSSVIFAKNANVEIFTSRGILTVNCGDEYLKGIIDIYDLSGRKIMSRSISANHSEFSLDRIGLYIVRITDTTHRPAIAKKIMVY